MYTTSLAVVNYQPSRARLALTEIAKVIHIWSWKYSPSLRISCTNIECKTFTGPYTNFKWTSKRNDMVKSMTFIAMVAEYLVTSKRKQGYCNNNENSLPSVVHVKVTQNTPIAERQDV